MQFPQEFPSHHPAGSRLMLYPTTEHLCSCSKCLRRKYSCYTESAHLLPRQELEAQRRLVYPTPMPGFPTSPSQAPSRFGHVLETRSYYPGSATFAAMNHHQLPRYGYDSTSLQHGEYIYIYRERERERDFPFNF